MKGANKEWKINLAMKNRNKKQNAKYGIWMKDNGSKYTTRMDVFVPSLITFSGTFTNKIRTIRKVSSFSNLQLNHSILIFYLDCSEIGKNFNWNANQNNWTVTLQAWNWKLILLSITYIVTNIIHELCFVMRIVLNSLSICTWDFLFDSAFKYKR